MTVLRIGYALLLLTVLGLDAFCGSILSAAGKSQRNCNDRNQQKQQFLFHSFPPKILPLCQPYWAVKHLYQIRIWGKYIHRS